MHRLIAFLLALSFVPLAHGEPGVSAPLSTTIWDAQNLTTAGTTPTAVPYMCGRDAQVTLRIHCDNLDGSTAVSLTALYALEGDDVSTDYPLALSGASVITVSTAREIHQVDVPAGADRLYFMGNTTDTTDVSVTIKAAGHGN